MVFPFAGLVLLFFLTSSPHKVASPGILSRGAGKYGQDDWLCFSPDQAGAGCFPSTGTQDCAPQDGASNSWFTSGDGSMGSPLHEGADHT